MDTTGSRYRLSKYAITGNPNLMNDYFGINDEVQEILRQTFEKVQRKKNSTIRELHDLIEKYPHVPQFKNQLSTLYAFQGNVAKANEVNNWLLKEHPDYLFGKLNLAGEYIAKEEFDKVPEVLGEYMDIKELYPHRNEFHTNEVASFNRIALMYFVGIKDLKAAEIRLDVLKKLEDPLIEIEPLQMQVMALRLEKTAERWEREHKESRSVKVVAKKVVEPTTEKPVFTHPQVEHLYCNGMGISSDIITEILSLPRETLIPDLHKVIYDSMARFDYFSNKDWDNNSNEFLLHALFLLTELKSEESLPVLLDILRQDKDYLDYWFSDFLTEEVWECIYTLGFNQLDALKLFMMEPDHDCYARTQVSTAVSQIALYQPERRDEIIKWYEDLLLFFLAEKENDRIIDTNMIGFIVGDLLDMDAKELEPLLTEIYKHRLAGIGVCGSIEDVIQELHEPRYPNNDLKRKIYSIQSRYAYILKTWSGYQNGDDSEEDEEEWNDEPILSNTFISPFKPIVRSEPKVGRNDPCPCGSKLKYKKCHGK